MQCKGEVGGFKLYSIVVQLFEFINCQIPFLNYFTIREPLVLISFIKKNQNQRTSNPGYFKTLKQTFKLLVFMKELAMKWWFYGGYFSLKLRTMDTHTHTHIYIYIPEPNP
jgi:hypothetical protein